MAHFLKYSLIFYFILNGCGFSKLPDYEKIFTEEMAGPQYIARNIQVSYDDNRYPYNLELIKKVEIVGEEEYFITYQAYSKASNYNNFGVDSLIFVVDGKLIPLSIEDTYYETVFSYKGSYLANSIDFYYKITKEEIQQIASGKIVKVLSKSGNKIDEGLLHVKDIERFRIFLEKYGDK